MRVRAYPRALCRWRAKASHRFGGEEDAAECPAIRDRVVCRPRQRHLRCEARSEDALGASEGEVTTLIERAAVKAAERLAGAQAPKRLPIAERFGSHQVAPPQGRLSRLIFRLATGASYSSAPAHAPQGALI